MDEHTEMKNRLNTHAKMFAELVRLRKKVKALEHKQTELLNALECLLDGVWAAGGAKLSPPRSADVVRAKALLGKKREEQRKALAEKPETSSTCYECGLDFHAEMKEFGTVYVTHTLDGRTLCEECRGLDAALKACQKRVYEMKNKRKHERRVMGGKDE